MAPIDVKKLIDIGRDFFELDYTSPDRIIRERYPQATDQQVSDIREIVSVIVCRNWDYKHVIEAELSKIDLWMPLIPITPIEEFFQ